MPRTLPFLAVVLGIVGVIPFVICGLGSVATNFIGAQIAIQLLLAYGAVVLSFLGGIHWGVSLATDEGTRQRLTLGVLPSLLGWLTLALALYSGRPALGVALLIVLFFVAAAAEWKGHLHGGIPSGYIVLRIAVTVAIEAILITVLVLRLVGGHLLL
jgi:hypothetical protein